jgi:ADP-ribose pyrophosphatase
MVDPGEYRNISVTLKREFMEEATNSTEQTEEGKNKIDEHLKQLFSKGIEIYRGYVDDPRNTDNAWMETVAYNFHDKKNEFFQTFALTAGRFLKLSYCQIRSKKHILVSF